MKINGNEIRPGNTIRHKGELWYVVKAAAVQPGKSGAYAQIELRNILTGSKHNERVRASESIERIRLEQRSYQYLYADGDRLAFMDLESYEQIELLKSFVGERVALLQESMEVMIESYEGKPIGFELPEQVVVTIAETEPALKGQTATSSYKPAILENGMRVSVPPFVEVGQKIILATRDLTYVKRAES